MAHCSVMHALHLLTIRVNSVINHCPIFSRVYAGNAAKTTSVNYCLRLTLFFEEMFITVVCVDLDNFRKMQNFSKFVYGLTYKSRELPDWLFPVK